VHPSANEAVHVSGRELLAAVDPSLDLVPTYVTGTLSGAHPAQQDLAIAANGTIAAVTRSYTDSGQTKFGAMIPEKSLHAGANEVSVYAVNGSALTELRGSDVTYALQNGALEASNGTSIRVGRAIAGEVRGTRASSGSTLGGWAANVKARKPARSIVVLVDGKSVFVGDNGNITRNDIRNRYGVANTGFIFRLPGSLLPGAGAADDVRVFAVAGNAASELKYLRGYPWKTG